jgi:Xaa-Pro aminopeptidase
MIRYQPLPTDFYKGNRSRFAAAMQPGFMAVFFSNDIPVTNADGTTYFRQNNDLQYLCGIDQDETALIIFPDSGSGKHKEILFIQETNEEILLWHGYKYTKEEARAISGIETVYYTSEMDRVLYQIVVESAGIYLNSNEHFRSVIEVETREIRLGNKLKATFPFHTIARSAPIMHKLRFVKQAAEVEMIEKACKITNQALHRILKMVKPGIMEYEVEAEIIHEGVRNGCRNYGYLPIIASGANACVLHYNDNNNRIADGDLILMDFGHEYGNYNSDLTRCVPANGKFSARQKDVYNAVLRVNKAATNLLVPGAKLDSYTAEVGLMIQEELIGLGLFTKADVANQDPEKPLFRKYFAHGVSHSLGMDVHDVGNRFQALEAGMVFTVEPGIYIREEGIGVRIENNVLLTETTPINLMREIPIEVEHIEDLMQSGR